MGEYTEEAIQNGICENFRKEHEPFHFYNNSIWEDVSGTLRQIKDMDSLHICFVMNYILSGNCKVKGNRCYLFGRILANRGFFYADFKRVLEGFKINTYYIYSPNSPVYKYYKDLLRKYPDYDWSPLISYMYWK